MTSDVAQEAPAGRRRHRGGRYGAGKFVRDVIVIILIAILASYLLKTFVIRSFYIPSGSMENTLEINDRIIVDELVPRFFPIRRGDVVVFTDPGGWLPPSPPEHRNAVATGVDWFLSQVGLSASDSDDHLVKRVIGIGGDHVVCCNASGQITVNGHALKEPYTVIPAGHTAAATLHFNVRVPKGELWVMGDNRYNSQDSSRNQNLPGKGFVPVSDVVGRAVVISWPVSRWTWLSRYPQVFAGSSAGGA
ncbi:MAG TPA: signal peptidase I [Microbacteriaceae bacterium]|nr:signal peptidase I [Microbacteriaceae bacterium]